MGCIMENKEKESHIVFGLESGLIEPLENEEGKYKLTKNGEKFVMVASYYLALSILYMLFQKRKK